MKICLKNCANWSNVFDIPSKQKELISLQNSFTKPNFWGNKEKAANIQKTVSVLQEDLKLFSFLEQDFKDIQDLWLLAQKDNELQNQIEKKVVNFEKLLDEKLSEVYFSGDYDKKNAILTIQAGAGGRDSEDWVCLLLKMYQKYCEKKGWECKILSQTFTQGGGPEGRIGIREVEMEIKGNAAFGFLKKESGAHRLVRLSPFSAKQLRHTSFAKVEVIPKIEEQEITNEILKPEDLKIEMFRSSGAGGQNVNKRETAVRITHTPTGLVATCQTERYQGVNKKIALEILAGKVLHLKEKAREEEIAKLQGKTISADFGHQIRSYVLHPYNLVKDHRTNVETTNTQAVLNGDIGLFIENEIQLC
ncbi:MAG: peptide chain release factor 2 [Candidatus Pacebacteria bacterium]|nr:peptide chain release factor 2 [Candidatus Paceibacterota bacterium]